MSAVCCTLHSRALTNVHTGSRDGADSSLEQFCPVKVKFHVQKQVISNSYQPGKDSMFYGGLSIILVLFLTLFVFLFLRSGNIIY